MFLLRGIPLEAPGQLENSKDEKIEEEQIDQKELTNIVLQQVQSINDYQDDIEKINALLDQEKARGVIEGGYIIARYNKETLLFAGTDKLYDCIGLLFYDYENKIAYIYHCSTATNVEKNFKQIIIDLNAKGSKSLQVRLFGGVKTDKYDSTKLLEKIIKNLHQLSENFTINICSIDVIDRIADYRKAKEEQTSAQGGDLTIGFALNLENGKVLFQNNLYANRFHFDTEASSCGFFSGSAKRAAIFFAVKSYWPVSPDVLDLEYDSDEPKFDQQYEIKYNENSLKGILDVILGRLTKEEYCTNYAPGEITIMRFMEDNIQSWLDEYSKKFQNISATQHLLRYITYLKYYNTYSTEPQPYNEDEINGLFINWLLTKNIIQSWCVENVKQHITDILSPNAENNKLQDFLGKIFSNYHLLDELKRYKSANNMIIQSNMNAADFQYIFLFKLKKLVEEDADTSLFDKLLEDWKKETLKKVVKEEFIKKLAEVISSSKHNKSFDKPYRSSIKLLLSMWLEKNNEILPYLHPKSDKYSDLTGLIDNLANTIAPRISRWCPCGEFLNQDTEDKLSSFLEQWKNTVLDSHSVTIENKEEDKDSDEKRPLLTP